MTLILVSEVRAIFSNKDFPSISGAGARLRNNNSLYYFGSPLNGPDQQSKRGLLLPAVGVFVKLSLALEESIASPYGKNSLKLYMSVYTQFYMHHRYFG